MRDTIGNLFNVFDSNVTVLNAELINVTTSQMLIYLSNSRADITSAVITNMTYSDVGSLATVFDQSALRLRNVILKDLTGSEHGVISLHQSSMSLIGCTVTGLNMSLIIAQDSAISISDSDVTNVWTSFEGKTLSMLPNGGFISCIDCSIIHISNTHFSHISANKGGVIHAQSTDENAVRDVVMEKSKFEGCVGKTFGGVLQTFAYRVTINNCSFEDNSADMGGVIDFQSTTQILFATNSSFVRNTAAVDGSCIRWAGKQPQLSDNSYVNNSALYGNPQASIPHHFALLLPGSLQPVTLFPLQGVTGQQMEEPLLIGVFDVLEQLIVTDNSTLVTIELPEGLIGSGNNEVLAAQGLASFSLLFSPFIVSTFNLTFYSDKTDIANITVQYRFRDCQPGEIRTATGCIPCPKNSYSFQPSDSSCTLCPSHVQCFGRADVYLDVDYWRSNNLTDDIYPCLVRDACLGGLNSDCADGYTSTLCGGCEDGYYKYGMWECRECAGEIHQAGRGIIISVLVLSAVTIPPTLFFKKEGTLYKLALLYRVLYNYAQTFLFVVLLHVQWPFTTLVHHEIWRIIGSLGQLLIYSGCQFTDNGISDYFFQVIVAAFYPLLLVAASALVWIAVDIKLRYSFKQLCSVIFSVSFVAIYNFLPALSLMTISMYQCTEVAGKSWLVADSAQECWTASHLTYIYTLTIPLLCFIAAVHLLAVWSLKQHSDPSIFRYVHQYMIAGYKHSCENWEIWLMLRKFLLVCLSLAYPKLDRFSHIILFACIIGIGTHMDVKSLPYLSNWLNLMNLLTNVSIIVSVLPTANGTESELTALSSVSSFLVVAVGCAALRSRMSEGGKQYVLAEQWSSQNSQPRVGVSAQSVNMSEVAGLRPPPGSPAEVDVKDIKLVESSF